jgi:hypothetical protein
MPCERSSRNMRRAILHTTSRSTLPSHSVRSPALRSASTVGWETGRCRAGLRGRARASSRARSRRQRKLPRRCESSAVAARVSHCAAHGSSSRSTSRTSSRRSTRRRWRERGSAHAARLDTWRTTWQMAYKRATRRRDVHAAQRARARVLAWGRSARECGASAMADCATCGPAVPTGTAHRICCCPGHICTGTGLSLPHLRQDRARRTRCCHICAGTGPTTRHICDAAGHARRWLACDSPPVCMRSSRMAPARVPSKRGSVGEGYTPPFGGYCR